MSIQIMLRVDPAFKQEAERRASQESRTLSGWIKWLMERELGMPALGTSIPPELPDDVAGAVTPVVTVPAPGKAKREKVRCSKHKRLDCKLCGGG